MEHSRKPGGIRMLIEKVSPPTLFGDVRSGGDSESDWTVYGNQVERRLF
jgi:N6-adenosine-specific RNA methylase IME4